ncbi:MAG: hypothetical protein C0392_09140 [Syntrophus sp. (in: bacteria)]|nr:hypothetical protein [Syntrophus sp. (in: bacteria)]
MRQGGPIEEALPAVLASLNIQNQESNNSAAFSGDIFSPSFKRWPVNQDTGALARGPSVKVYLKIVSLIC